MVNLMVAHKAKKPPPSPPHLTLQMIQTICAPLCLQTVMILVYTTIKVVVSYVYAFTKFSWN